MLFKKNRGVKGKEVFFLEIYKNNLVKRVSKFLRCLFWRKKNTLYLLRSLIQKFTFLRKWKHSKQVKHFNFIMTLKKEKRNEY